MKIRRFVAKDMRTALSQIKDELGADAVIMSNKKIPEGVELMAAVDYQQASAEPSASESDNTSRAIKSDVVSLSQNVVPQPAKQAAPNQSVAPNSQTNDNAAMPDSLSALLNRKVQQSNAETAKVAAPSSSTTDIEQQFKNFTDKLEQGVANSPHLNAAMQKHVNEIKAEQESEQQAQALSESNTSPSMHQQATNSQVASLTSAAQNDEMEKMRAEMATIRQLLEHQVSGLMWQDMAQKDPHRAVLVNRLMSMGLTEHIADQIASSTPAYNDEEEAWQHAKLLVTQQLNTTNNEIIRKGGVISLVGPTGVGKTTTVAKLAARFAQIHGADKVVMISTDSYRIAGYEQLETYAKIIGCHVGLAQDAKSLDNLLSQYSDKKLILIDTAGMGQRDLRLAEHLTTLIANSRVRIRNYLVLSANTQQRVLQENVERFKRIPLAGCIYTKLDESLSIGEIIATSIQNGLPIGYLTDGQRVPEDIKVANVEKLVTLADRLATKTNGNFEWRPMPQNNTVMQ